MKYTDRSRFSEKDIEEVERIAKAVCYVCGITVAELRSDSRKRLYSDPRKLFCNYVMNNIELKVNIICFGNKYVKTGLALPLLSWYLNQDHSSIIHACTCADGLYKADKDFKNRFDTLIKVLNHPLYRYNMEIIDLYKINGDTWESVKSDDKYSMAIRMSLMPIGVAHKITNLFMRGYSPYMIASELDISEKLVEQYIRKFSLKEKRNNLRLSNKFNYKKGEYFKKYVSVD